MSSSRTTSNNSNNNNNHRRQWSEGIVSTDKSIRLYKGIVFLAKFYYVLRKIAFFRWWSPTDSTSGEWISLGRVKWCTWSYSKLPKWMFRGINYRRISWISILVNRARHYSVSGSRIKTKNLIHLLFLLLHMKNPKNSSFIVVMGFNPIVMPLTFLPFGSKKYFSKGCNLYPRRWIVYQMKAHWGSTTIGNQLRSSREICSSYQNDQKRKLYKAGQTNIYLSWIFIERLNHILEIAEHSVTYE
jgi:hypothetical protein